MVGGATQLFYYFYIFQSYPSDYYVYHKRNFLRWFKGMMYFTKIQGGTSSLSSI